MTEESARSRIVVGVDGSEAGTAALVWAADQASGQGADLEAVMVWMHDASGGRTLAEARQVHTHDLETRVTAALKGRPEVSFECLALDGDASDVLVDLSRDATMLVVGSHGTGRLRDILVGSVSSACLRHASCPVVVIPPAARNPVTRLGRLLAEIG